MEVQQAIAEYRISGRIVVEIRDNVLPPLRRAIASPERLFRRGEVDVFGRLIQTRNFNVAVIVHILLFKLFA